MGWLDQPGWDWTWVGLDWMGFDWIGLDWVGHGEIQMGAIYDA